MTREQKASALVAAAFLVTDLATLVTGIDSAPNFLSEMQIGLWAAQVGLGATWVALGRLAYLWARMIVFLVGGALLAGLVLASWNTAEGVIFTSIEVAQALLSMGVLGFMRWSGFAMRNVDTATAEVDDASCRTQFSIRDVLALTTLIAAWSAAYGYLKPPSGINPSEAFVVVLFGGCFATCTILSVLATLAARRTVIALMVAWTTSAALGAGLSYIFRGGELIGIYLAMVLASVAAQSAVCLIYRRLGYRFRRRSPLPVAA